MHNAHRTRGTPVSQPAKRSAPFKLSVHGQVELSILLLPNFSLGELSSLVDAFTLGNQELPGPQISWQMLGFTTCTRSSMGAELKTVAITPGFLPAHNLLVLGECPLLRSQRDRVFSIVRRSVVSGCRVIGMGDSIEVLAATGMLDGTSACAHWNMRKSLNETYPRVIFLDRVFVSGSQVTTCVGGTAAVDLAIACVEQSAGPKVAYKVADRLNSPYVRNFSDTYFPRPIQRFGRASRALCAAIESIECADEGRLNLARITARIGISQRHLQRLFKVHLGQTPMQYHRAKRLEQARELLRRTSMSVIEVAVATGFSNPSYFSHQYTDSFGLSPSRERQVHNIHR